jgi:hypothetical protein
VITNPSVGEIDTQLSVATPGGGDVGSDGDAVCAPAFQDIRQTAKAHIAAGKDVFIR